MSLNSTWIWWPGQGFGVPFSVEKGSVQSVESMPVVRETVTVVTNWRELHREGFTQTHHCSLISVAPRCVLLCLAHSGACGFLFFLPVEGWTLSCTLGRQKVSSVSWWLQPVPCQNNDHHSSWDIHRPLQDPHTGWSGLRLTSYAPHSV